MDVEYYTSLVNRRLNLHTEGSEINPNSLRFFLLCRQNDTCSVVVIILLYPIILGEASEWQTVMLDVNYDWISLASVVHLKFSSFSCWT